MNFEKQHRSEPDGIERFESHNFKSEGLSKGKGDPSKNEDAIIISDKVLMVADGATDKSGKKYEFNGREESGGLIASRLVEETVRNNPNLSGVELIEEIKKTFQTKYRELGIFDDVSNPNNALNRFTSVVCTATINEGEVFFTVVGDVGLKVDGKIYRQEKYIDRINARLRSSGYKFLKEKYPNLSKEELLNYARKIALHGTKRLRENEPEIYSLLGEDGIEFMEVEVKSLTRKIVDGFDNLSEADKEKYIEMSPTIGINGQGSYQNSTDPVLGYGAIDGFDIPERFITTYKFPVQDIATVEMFSDGYFKIPAEPTVEAWESAWNEVEETDPEKLIYESTKGSGGGSATDDRSLIITNFNK